MKNFENLESKEFELSFNKEFLNFQSIEVSQIDESKPWKPALTVNVIKENGDFIENLDANTVFFSLKANNNVIDLTAEVAGHIDNIHIKSKDLGSKFSYNSLLELLEDLSKKLKENMINENGVTALSINMEKAMGQESLMNFEELLMNNIVSENEINELKKYKEKIIELNSILDNVDAQQRFIEKYNAEHSADAIKLKLIRSSVIVPYIETTRKQNTNNLFLVIGPGGKNPDHKIFYTMAPGRLMPKHPNAQEHMDENGNLNKESFLESSEAWFNTVLLDGE